MWQNVKSKGFLCDDCSLAWCRPFNSRDRQPHQRLEIELQTHLQHSQMLQGDWFNWRLAKEWLVMNGKDSGCHQEDKGENPLQPKPEHDKNGQGGGNEPKVNAFPCQQGFGLQFVQEGPWPAHLGAIQGRERGQGQTLGEPTQVQQTGPDFFHRWKIIHCWSHPQQAEWPDLGKKEQGDPPWGQGHLQVPKTSLCHGLGQCHVWQEEEPLEDLCEGRCQDEPGDLLGHAGGRDSSLDLWALFWPTIHVPARWCACSHSQNGADVLWGQFSGLLGQAHVASFKPRPQCHGLLYLVHPSD